jgi:hypothetical protein
MYPRPLTARERAVLDSLLAVDFNGVEELRTQAARAEVRGGCQCGCPSINFFEGQNSGMTMLVNGAVRDSATFDGLFLFSVGLPGVGAILGGIEWVGKGASHPDELPSPDDLVISVAGP